MQHLPEWNDIVADEHDHAQRRRKTRRLYLTGVALLVSSVLILMIPLAIQGIHQYAQRRAADATVERVDGWPAAKRKSELLAAQGYNAALAQSTQPVLGEVRDPFANNARSRSESDTTYQSLLNVDNGTMATLSIPKISLKLAIYHGTSKEVLAQGVGHLYGTSLPVGGVNTNAVLTGHRGLPNAVLFTRLDELRAGEHIYVNVLGGKLAYTVQQTVVVNPRDVRAWVKVRQGEDLLTLMTCTPYGVNTQRLLVIAQRAPLHDGLQEIPSLLQDRMALAAIIACNAAIICGVIAIRRAHLRRPRSHHMAMP